MNIKKIGRLFLAASLLGMMTSCHLSEPDNLNNSGNGSTKVKEIYMFGITAVSVKYDSKDRVTAINAPNFDFKLNITYDGNQIKGMSGSVDESEMIFTDIKLNSQGFIESFTIIESDEPAPTFTKFEYDAQGHLLRQYQDGEVVYTYTWNSGLLTRVDEHAPDHAMHVAYTYGDIKNEKLQWSPFWYGTNGFFNLTGFFGVAPSKYITSATDLSGEYHTVERYDYRLNSYGLIQAERANIEGETLTLTYYY